MLGMRGRKKNGWGDYDSKGSGLMNYHLGRILQRIHRILDSQAKPVTVETVIFKFKRADIAIITIIIIIICSSFVRSNSGPGPHILSDYSTQ